MSSILKSMYAKAHYQHYEMCLLRRLFSSRYKKKNVLDVGCGNGRNIPLLQEADCRIIGVDRNEDQVNSLKERGICAFLPEKLPPDETFDVILMSHVIEHLTPETLRDFMDFYLARLRPEGKLVIATPVLGEHFYYDCTHIRPYYPQSLRMLIGGLDTPSLYRSKFLMRLEDIWFFHEPFRPRMHRAYYDVYNVSPLARSFVSYWNKAMALLHTVSNGRIGTLASWIGIYGKVPS